MSAFATLLRMLLRPAFAVFLNRSLRRGRLAFRMITMAACVICMTQSPGRAAAGRAMTIDDLLAAVRVTDPQLSPDGSRVVFVRTTTDLKTGARNGDIWTVLADGSGAARELMTDEVSGR
jgi:hypothetical protein